VDRPLLDHEGPWTESAYLDLASGDARVELADGALLLGPGTTDDRGRVVEHVRAAVAGALPDGLHVVGPVRLRLGRDCVLVPDLVVTRADPDAALLDAGDALMVLEVVGDEHGAVDRSFKPQLYARSGIPYSVLVDHEARFGMASMIIGGRYHEYARTDRGAVLRVEEPFALEVDLAAGHGDHGAVRAAG
jgi:Putative restriction endonuclease